MKKRLSVYISGVVAKHMSAVSRTFNDANAKFQYYLTQITSLAGQVQQNATTVATDTQQVSTNTASVADMLSQIQNIQAQINAGLKTFQASWLGAHDSDPTTTADGSPILKGAEYLNTKTNALRVYTGVITTDEPNGWKDADAEYEAMNAAATILLQTMQQLASQTSQNATDAAASAQLAKQYLEALQAYNLVVPSPTVANYIITISADGKSYQARSPADTLALLGAMSTSGGNFTGPVSGPTAAKDTATSQLATTAFVLNQLSSTQPLMDGTAAIGTSMRGAREDHVHPTDTSRAAKAGDNTVDFNAKTIVLTNPSNPSQKWTVSVNDSGAVQFNATTGGGGFSLSNTGEFYHSAADGSANRVILNKDYHRGWVGQYHMMILDTPVVFSVGFPGTGWLLEHMYSEEYYPAFMGTSLDVTPIGVNGVVGDSIGAKWEATGAGAGGVGAYGAEPMAEITSRWLMAWIDVGFLNNPNYSTLAQQTWNRVYQGLTGSDPDLFKAALTDVSNSTYYNSTFTNDCYIFGAISRSYYTDLSPVVRMLGYLGASIVIKGPGIADGTKIIASGIVTRSSSSYSNWIQLSKPMTSPPTDARDYTLEIDGAKLYMVLNPYQTTARSFLWRVNSATGGGIFRANWAFAAGGAESGYGTIEYIAD